MTDAIPEGVASAASCMDSPRIFTSFKPSSKDNASAKVKAVYSPRDKPAATSMESIIALPSSDIFIFSSAAKEDT